MKKLWKTGLLIGVSASSLIALTTPDYASLATFQTYTGSFGLSNDGFGAADGLGVISASAPLGATVKAAYLYSATFFSNAVPTTVSLDGTSITFTASFDNTFLSAHRADVTSIIASKVDGGLGGIYDFNVDEGSDNGRISGEALVVVYELPSLPVSTIGIQDGFSATGGDSTSINFATPLDPTDPGFFADMELGINHSCCAQSSTVTVNGLLLTNNAGNHDDGEDLFDTDSSLITVGGFDDPFSPSNPDYASDHEKYDLSPFITTGDTSISINTNNPTNDDNIFLATFHVSGVATVGPPAVPLPPALWLLGSGLAMLSFAGWRRKRSHPA